MLCNRIIGYICKTHLTALKKNRYNMSTDGQKGKKKRKSTY